MSILPSQIRLVLALPRQLDRATLPPFLSTLPGVAPLATVSRVDEVEEACRRVQANGAMIDASHMAIEAITAGQALLERQVVRAVAFLDDRCALARAQRALRLHGAFYFSRSDDINNVLREMRRFLCQRRVDAASPLQPEVLPVNSEKVRRELAGNDSFGFLSLTAREQQVMTYLAKGNSVKEAAGALGLAESTTDNHKTRLMRKLQVKRSTQLTRIAMQIGLID